MLSHYGNGGEEASMRENDIVLHLVKLESPLSVCKLAAPPEHLPSEGFYAITRTDEELSVVCETQSAPKSVIACEDGWRALKVLGPLDFGLVGILARISTTLAKAGVPLFAISTFDTDYVLVKEENLPTAVEALRNARFLVDA